MGWRSLQVKIVLSKQDRVGSGTFQHKDEKKKTVLFKLDWIGIGTFQPEDEKNQNST